MSEKKYELETLALHAGYEPDETTLSRGVPVHRTSSYIFKNTEHAANLFGLKELGNIYTRLMNPTHDVLEKRIAAMEGGAAAVAVASGTSAIFYSIINICSAGEEVISAQNLYGGTYTMFENIFPQFGIKVHFVPYDKPEEYEKKINDKTRAIFVETIGNPSLGFTDFDKISEIAVKHHLPLIVDSTFTTPYLFNPINYGANIVVHSLTKWLGGHGTGIGGVIVDAGNFDWSDPKFKLFNEPDESYHGIRYAHDLGDLTPIAFALRIRLVPLRNLGACISPDNAWIFMQGIETLSLRMQRHCDNAMETAEYLSSSPYVEWVRYPGLPDDPGHAVASKYLKKGFGGMIVFGIKGGYEAAVKFINNIKLFSHLANVGDAKSLLIHPASTTHSQLSDASLKAGGISHDMIRLSIGIENIKDIIFELEKALKISQE